MAGLVACLTEEELDEQLRGALHICGVSDQHADIIMGCGWSSFIAMIRTRAVCDFVGLHADLGDMVTQAFWARLDREEPGEDIGELVLQDVEDALNESEHAKEAGAVQ